MENEEAKKEKEKKEETKQEDIKKEEQNKEDTKKEETKEETKETKKEEEKHDDTKESDDKYSNLESQLKAITDELNSQKIKNTILEKIDDKELQKAVLETGLVKSVDDIDKVIKIVELSKTLNKSKFQDGYKPADEFQGDAYKQAEAKKDVLGMIKQKLTGKSN